MTIDDDDLSQYVIVEDPLECVRLVWEAATTERSAMQHDREGRVLRAVEEYRQTSARLQEAARACPEAHPDKQALWQHAGEVLARAAYLEGLTGLPEGVPLEEHIHDVQITLGVRELAPAAAASSRCGSAGGGAPRGGWRVDRDAKVLGAAAAISGAAGLLLLGPLGGAALGVAAALAAKTPREHPAGCAARKVGDAGVELLTQAEMLNRKHKISQRVACASANVIKGTTEQAHQLLTQLSERHRLVGKFGRSISCVGSFFANARTA